MNVVTRSEADAILRLFQHSFEELDLLSRIPIVHDLALVNSLDPSSELLPHLEKLWECEKLLSQIESTSLLFDSKDISLLRNSHRYLRLVSKMALNEENIIVQHRPQASEGFIEFIQTLNQLSEQIYSKLTCTIENEEQNLNEIHELGDKTRLLEETKRILESKIQELAKQKEIQLNDLEETKLKLQKELNELSLVSLKLSDHG
jgi:hypothetical protein